MAFMEEYDGEISDWSGHLTMTLPEEKKKHLRMGALLKFKMARALNLIGPGLFFW